MAEKKKKVVEVETAEQKLVPSMPVLRKIGEDGYARCGSCGCRLVNVEERVKCRFCWYCGAPVRWK